MTRLVVLRYETRHDRVPAAGPHAEVLAEMTGQAQALIRFIAAEQNGTYDGLGQSAWVGSDPIQIALQRLAALVQERLSILSTRYGA